MAEEKQKEGHETSKSKKDARDRQAMMIIGGFIALILIFVGIFIYMQSLNHFTYNGLKFVKTQEGKITYFNAAPIMFIKPDNTPYTRPDGSIYAKEFQFRNDPRKLNNIPVDINSIEFKSGQTAYIAYDDLKICEYNGVAAVNLGGFFSDSLVKVKGALANKTNALASNMTFANCENNPNDVVIIVKNGNETRIDQTSNNCYIITSKDCDILKATERFQFAFLSQYLMRGGNNFALFSKDYLK